MSLSGAYTCDLLTGQTRWSEGVYALLGYTIGEVEPSSEAFASRIHPDDMERIQQAIADSASGVLTEEICYRVILPGGTVRHLRTIRHWLEDGHTLAGSMLDITEGVAADEARERERAQLRIGEEVGRIGSFTMRLDDGVIHWSPMMFELMEVGPEHVPTASDFDERVHPQDMPSILAGRKRMVEDGQGTALIVRLRRRDGTWMHSFIDSRIEPSAQGPMLVGCLQDVTHQVELSRRAQASRRLEALGRLSGGIAHDVNNALTIVSGNLDLLLATQPESPEAVGVRMALGNIASMAQQLLAFARSEIMPTGAVDLIQFLTGNNAIFVEAAGPLVDLQLALPARLPLVAADTGRLQQVFINLLINARDAMPHGGTVRVSARSAGDLVEVVVADDGCGMSLEILEQAVEPFFTTKEHGSGLGLASVYGTMQALGGSIELDSAEGEGTRASLLLRCVPGAEAPEPVAAPTSRRIAVADDENSLRLLVVRVLERAGFEVVASGDGEAVLAMLGEQPLDLLLTDVRMPGLDGPSLVGALRRTRPALRVLYMTGHAPDPTRLADPVVSKPFRPHELVAAVEERLSGG